ncbi:MAG: tellurium resistance protein, partial [Acinetobacter sp.]
MPQVDVLVPLNEIALDPADLLSIKRNELVPLLNDQYRLNHYADALIQAQSALLHGVDPKLTKQLSQSIEQLIQTLSDSKKYLKPRKFNALQKWLGIDLEFGSSQVEYYKNLDRHLDRANQLSQRLQIEIQKS